MNGDMEYTEPVYLDFTYMYKCIRYNNYNLYK